MTDRPLYESMMAAGTLDRRHELALMRYAACREAARKAGWRCSSDDPAFLTAQYAFFHGNFYFHVKELVDLLTQPPDPAWTYQNYLEMLPEFGLADSFDLDYVLDRVGQFLAIDHPARYREEKRREAEMYKRWREHPDERPSFLRRKRETA